MSRPSGSSRTRPTTRRAAWTSSLAGALRAADPDHLVTIGTRQPGGRRRAVPGGRGRRRARLRDRPPVPDLRTGALPGRPARHPDDACGRVRDGAGRRGGPAGRCSTNTARRRPSSTRTGSPPTTDCSPGRRSVAARSASSPGAGPTPSRPPSAGRRTSASRTRPQFGVTDHTGRLRPRGRVLAELAATIRAIGDELDGLAGDGPSAAAAIPVPHEYVRPYDAASYGLDAPRPARMSRRNGSGRPTGIPPRSFAAGSTASSWPPGPACRSPSRASGSTTAGRRRRCSSCRPR